ncbi:O-linked N-acetylglucosamine transferase, SPINDLY family protein, partial [Nostoc sp. HG1]|nr:O-linked N-acetylglucosamine transferase, SPINDLY family protein [Nostoc sp. HG1]
MTFTNSAEALTPWQQQASQYLVQKNYAQAAQLYEQAIGVKPRRNESYYWQLGLLQLLQGEEAEAKPPGCLAMSEGESDQIEQWVV